MKKIISILILLLFILSKNVYAANYELKELIPEKIETTIVTNNFSYRKFSYNGEGYINFKSIKNLREEELPISISIGLFDKDKKNIGTINYCSKENLLAAKEEKGFSIPITKEYLGDGFKIKEIKYIAVLDDNITCKTEGKDYYIGQTVERIGEAKNTTFDSHETLFFTVIGIVGGVLLLLFLYSFMFTNSYENMDGEDVRIGYKKYNKELEDDRERELRMHPPKPKPKEKIKSDEVLEQEKKAQEEDKTGTDLHNLYK